MGNLHSYSKIKKAVILAGGRRTLLHTLDHYCPPCVLPVLNRPLIAHTLDFLKEQGIEEVAISLSDYNEILDGIKEKYSPELKIDFHIEDKPRGTAGALKDLEEFIGQDIFIAVNGSIFIDDINLYEAWEQFHKMNSTALVGVHEEQSPDKEMETAVIADSRLQGIYKIHPSIDRRSSWRTTGIYIFDPVIFKYIDNHTYMDIKEQLIPALRKEGLTISICKMKGSHKCLYNANGYFMLTRNILLDHETYDRHFHDMEEIADKVWAGDNVKISPKAYLLGPIIIGDNCRIDDWAQIIGPAVIGDRCEISDSVLCRESIIHSDIKLSRNAKIEFSIICMGAQVPAGQTVRNKIAVSGEEAIDVSQIPLDYIINGITFLSGITGTTQGIYQIIKRFLDLAISITSLVLLIPLFLLIALAVRLDSAGPVLFAQKRCGKDGKLFKMKKFRTMIVNAEEIQEKLLSQKNTDGPIFKMVSDPRITKVGGFLRKTSLDELPQLINVIKGEMSLVGPRPLIMDEMKFSSSWRDVRLKVKPGITGLWQIQGRSEASFHNWIRYDTYYVKNQSLALDIKILFKTIGVVLKKAGSY